MNVIHLIGRLTRDPEIKYSEVEGEESVKIAKYTLAVKRPLSRESQADFIQCTAFGKRADVVERYFCKGMRIHIDGSVRTGSYTNRDGVRIPTFEVIVSDQEFMDTKSDNEVKRVATQSDASTERDDFQSVPDDSQTPFK